MGNQFSALYESLNEPTSSETSEQNELSRRQLTERVDGVDKMTTINEFWIEYEKECAKVTQQKVAEDKRNPNVSVEVGQTGQRGEPVIQYDGSTYTIQIRYKGSKGSQKSTFKIKLVDHEARRDIDQTNMTVENNMSPEGIGVRAANWIRQTLD